VDMPRNKSFYFIGLKLLKKLLRELFNFWRNWKIATAPRLQPVEDRKNKGNYIYKSYRFEVLVSDADWTIMYFQYMP
jgi:hypothetical protein